MGAYIIIGSSAAGLSAAQTIRRLQPDREIIVLSKIRQSIPGVCCTSF